EAAARCQLRSRQAITFVVTVQFVGSGDAFGTDGRFHTCISLPWPQANVQLDCGVSSLIALKRLGLNPRSVDAVIVSHLHGDHFGGLAFLVLDQQFVRRERPLTIAGPIGLRERLLQAMDVFFTARAVSNAASSSTFWSSPSGCRRALVQRKSPPSKWCTQAVRRLTACAFAATTRSLPTQATPSGPTACWNLPLALTCSSVRRTHSSACRRFVLTDLGPAGKASSTT